MVTIERMYHVLDKNAKSQAVASDILKAFARVWYAGLFQKFRIISVDIKNYFVMNHKTCKILRFISVFCAR